MNRLVSFGMQPTKYRAIRTRLDGIEFASKAEAARYSQLKLMLKTGEIRNLELQPTYLIEINGMKVCKYRADFRYEANENGAWVPHVEDVKGYETALFRLKAKLVKAYCGFSIDLVRAK